MQQMQDTHAGTCTVEVVLVRLQYVSSAQHMLHVACILQDCRNTCPCLSTAALQVYATLTLAVGLLTLGIAADVAFHIGGVLTGLASFGSLLWLGFTTPADSQV
jgi:hypothetical protein